MAVIEFITVTTGSTTMNSRADMRDELVAEMRRAIRPGRTVPVPGGYGCQITPGPGAWAFTLYRDKFPITTCIVCWDSEWSDAAWEVAQNDVPDTVVLRRPRGVPWLTAKVEVTALMAVKDPRELVGLAQTELAIAWAIIETAGEASR